MTDSPIMVRLPQQHELLRRLKEVSSDPSRVARLYPIILREAGRKMYNIGVLVMLQQAIHDYIAGMPPSIQLFVQSDVADYITALIDDKAARDSVLQMFEEIRRKTN